MPRLNKYNFSKITSAKQIRENIETYSKSGGVYIQYINEHGIELLDDVQPSIWEKCNDQRLGLVYVGKSKDMQYRLRWHLGLVNTSHSCICHGTLSTLRLSYMANIRNIDCLSQQNKLNSFIDNHVFIKYCITKDFAEIEDHLIEEYSPPLNIKGNLNPFTKTNKQRRKLIKNSYRAKFKC